MNQSVEDPLRAHLEGALQGYVHPGVAVQCIASMGGGKGVVATKNIPKVGTVISAIPQHSMLHRGTALEILEAVCPLGRGPALCKELKKQPIMNAIIVALVWLKHHPRSIGDDSLRGHLPSVVGALQPWVDILPPCYDNLLETSEEQLSASHHSAAGYAAQCKANNEVRLPPRYLEKVQMEKRRFTAVAEGMVSTITRCIRGTNNCDIQRSVEEDAVVDCWLEQVFCIPRRRKDANQAAQDDNACPPAARGDQQHIRLLWSYNSLMSRGFSFNGPLMDPRTRSAIVPSASGLAGSAPRDAYLDSENGIWVMCPWIDFINFCPSCNIHIAGTNMKNGNFELKTARPIVAGDQLFLTYGNYTDYEIALWYGFTLCCVPPMREEQSGDRQPIATHHQDNCGYCFSPLADPDGDYPEDRDLRWARELAVSTLTSLYCTHDVLYAAVEDDEMPVSVACVPQASAWDQHIEKAVAEQVMILLNTIKRTGCGFYDAFGDCRLLRGSHGDGGMSEGMGKLIKFIRRCAVGCLDSFQAENTASDVVPSSTRRRPGEADIFRHLCLAELKSIRCGFDGGLNQSGEALSDAKFTTAGGTTANVTSGFIATITRDSMDLLHLFSQVTDVEYSKQ